MGLFKKRPDEPAEIDRLRAEIVAMRERLDATEAAKADLGQQVQSLSERIESTPQPEPSAPPPPSVDPGEIDMLRARVRRVNDRIQEVEGALNVRIDESEAVKHDLGEQIQQLTAQVQTPPPLPSTPPPPPPAPAIDAGEIDDLRAQAKQINERLDEFDSQIATRLAELDSRITSVSTELANQISELSNDVERVAQVSPASDESVDELRDSQERLAAEQARYQIAFRQDLADLADRLRRS